MRAFLNTVLILPIGHQYFLVNTLIISLIFTSVATDVLA